MKSENEKYCTECGEAINAKAELCPKCGVRQPKVITPPSEDQLKAKKDQERWIITMVLLMVLSPMGICGVHRFYNGKIGTGILMLLTVGGCGIWVLVDLIMHITGNMTGPDGEKMKTPW